MVAWKTKKMPTKTDLRVLIVFDGEAWFVRRVRLIQHNLTDDEKIYHCDLPIGRRFDSLDEAVVCAKEAMSKK